jgi:trk system potassium uptake protein TrkH
MNNRSSKHEFHYPRRDIPKVKQSQRPLRLTSSEQLVISFLGMIAVGTLGLLVLPGLYTGPRLGFIDALFIATSAICVTGLCPVETGIYFTFWGQLYLLVMIQFGGLGMLTFATFIISAFGGRPSLRSEVAISAGPGAMPHFPIRALVIDIILFTLICEMGGAIALLLTWGPKMGWVESIWPAIFHSVSAFCNAGFSTFEKNSLMNFADSPATLAIVSCLIIVGGIGFVVHEELYRYFIKRDPSIRRISIHTKMVLIATAFLIVVPVIGFAFFEWQQTLANLTPLNKIANSIFMSVTPRTAGFNSIDYGQASESTNFLTILLMSIGGSPGSTAGGIKTTTFVLLGLLAWGKLRGRAVSFGGRSISQKALNHATGLFVIMTTITLAGVFVLQVIDNPVGSDKQLIHRAFEVCSAVNTVGLSMGITDKLPGAAKLVLVALMFIGRLGPLAFFAAIESRIADRLTFRMATEDVIVG